VARCRQTVEDEAGFVAFVVAHVPGLDADLVRRIARVVVRTYRPVYDLTRAAPRPLDARVTVLPARGDQPSPFDTRSDYAVSAPVVAPLAADHYELLHAGGIDECAAALRARLAPVTAPEPADGTTTRRNLMPHVNIKYYATELTEAQEAAFINAVTGAVTTTFGCADDVVSVALEPVEPQDWADGVYRPESAGRPELLRKSPSY
jgi:phenylpyruvate tautomerase PptA (4-oxalocrotonate tautomerase family)